MCLKWLDAGSKSDCGFISFYLFNEAMKERYIYKKNYEFICIAFCQVILYYSMLISPFFISLPLYLNIFNYLIKVFRSNGRPYCYSFVSFSLLLRSSVSNGRSYCYPIVSFSLLLLFFLQILYSRFLKNGSIDFHDIFRTDSKSKISDILFLLWWRHFRFWKIAIFLVFAGVRCPDFFSKSIRDTKLKFLV